MPTTAALLIGILLGTYVVAPIVDSGTTTAQGVGAPARGIAAAGSSKPDGSADASSPVESPGASGTGTSGTSAKPGTTAKPTVPASPGTSPKPGASAPSPSPSAVPAAALAAAKEGVVPILYYHRVENLPRGFAGWSKKSQDDFLVDNTLPFAFLAQLDWLKSHGYTTILPRDLAAHWDSGKVLPKRPVILTFDDGFSSWRSFVLPALQQRRMVAEFYVVIANVGRSLSWDDVRTLAKAGMGIGAHDVQHFQLAGGGVPTASLAVMQYQVREAKRLLELNIGKKVDSMAYVGGGFNATLLAVAQQAGYTTARSIERGVNQPPANRYHLHVSRIGWQDDVTHVYNGRLAPGLPTFAKRVSGANPG